MLNPDGHLSRRKLLKTAAATSLLGGAAGTVAAAPITRPVRASSPNGRPRADAPRNIIFMVADGMSMAAPSLAEPFSQQIRQRGTNWYRLAQQQSTLRAFLQTESLSSMVTDSAAASSAWASGSRICNGSVNMLPDGTALTPIGRLARDKGKRIGLVTTTSVTHATPAGFAAIHIDRDAEQEIAPQYLDVVDIVLGGGSIFFDEPTYKRYSDAGYDVCRSLSAFERSSSVRMLGTFAPEHLPMVVDLKHWPERLPATPTLAAMTAAALKRLGDHDGGFLLQVEGGRVDHAGHYNDCASLMWEQLHFDDALGVALQFVADRDDTLLIVTTDHGTGNPGLIGIGTNYNQSTDVFQRIASVRTSYETVYATLVRARGEQPNIAPAVCRDILRQMTGVVISNREAAAIATVTAGYNTEDTSVFMRGPEATIGQVLGNHIGVQWVSTTHTNDLAPTLITGRGVDHFKGLMHHVDVYSAITGMWGIDHVNATMTRAEAMPLLQRGVNR